MQEQPQLSNQEILSGIQEMASQLVGLHAESAQKALKDITPNDLDSLPVDSIIELLSNNAEDFGLDEYRQLLTLLVDTPAPKRQSIEVAPEPIPEAHLPYIPPTPHVAHETTTPQTSNFGVYVTPVMSAQESSGQREADRTGEMMVYTPFADRAFERFQGLFDIRETNDIQRISLEKVLEKKVEYFYTSLNVFKQKIPELIEYMLREALRRNTDLNLTQFIQFFEQRITYLLNKAMNSKADSLDHSVAHSIGRDKQKSVCNTYYNLMMAAGITPSDNTQEQIGEIARVESLNSLCNMMYCLVATFTYPVKDRNSATGALRYYPYPAPLYQTLLQKINIRSIVAELNSSILEELPMVQQKLRNEAAEKKALEEAGFQKAYTIYAKDAQRQAQAEQEQRKKERLIAQSEVVRLIDELHTVHNKNYFVNKKTVISALIATGKPDSLRAVIRIFELHNDDADVATIITKLNAIL